MKKLLILLFTPLICLSQGDFRKMNWGDSVEDLKKTYPETTFEEMEGDDWEAGYTEEEVDYLYHYGGNLIGIDVTITYVFMENKLVAGSCPIATNNPSTLMSDIF